MSTLVWDETGARYFETGVSKGIFFPIDYSTGVPWNGLVAVSIDPSGGGLESYYFDGIKYMDRTLAEDFQATVQAISTPKEFERCEGTREVQFGMKTHFNMRDKFHMAWRTEVGSDETQSAGYKWHIAYNCLVQPSARAYQTIADTTTMDSRAFVITTTPACGRHSYFTFDSREGNLADLEAQLMSGSLPKCYELAGLAGPPGGGGGTPPDPDFGCASLLTDLENYNPGQELDVDLVNDIYETIIYGKINNGFDTLVLPAAGAFAANDSAASEVGTGDILADDDDATYISSADGDLGYTIGLPPLAGYVPGCRLELHIRMSISGDVNPDDPDNLNADAQVHISTDAGGDDTLGGFSDGTDEGMGFALTAVDGTPVDYVVPLKMDAWVNSTIDDVVTALEAGAYLNVVGVSNNNPDTTPAVLVYEASVVMINSTEPAKALRARTLDDYALIEQHISDEDTGDDVSASNTSSIDFKVIEVPLNTDYDLVTCNVIQWLVAGTGNDPGYLDVEAMVDGVPGIKWVQDDSSTLVDGLHSVLIETNKWYRAKATWNFETCKIQVVSRDSGVSVYENTVDASDMSPVGFVQHYGGVAGSLYHTYEIMLDNAKMQIHCHDESPALERIEIDVPLTQGRLVGNEEDTGTAFDVTHDYPAAWPETLDYTRWFSSTYTHVGGTYIYPVKWDDVLVGTDDSFVPDTPAGYSLTEIRFIIKAHMTGGDPDIITADSSGWGYSPAPGKSPYLADTHSGVSLSFDTFPTTAPSDWIVSESAFDPSNDHYQSGWNFIKWFATFVPPHPAEGRKLVVNGLGMRFIYDPV